VRFQAFMDVVEERGRVGPAAARRAADATLRVLAERITQKEAHDLAAQLPGELQPPLVQGTHERGLFAADEFVRRVAEREEIAPVEARMHVQAVLTAVRAAVSEGELEDVLQQLSPDYLDLFGPDYPDVGETHPDGYAMFGLTMQELESIVESDLLRQTGFDGASVGAIARVLAHVLDEDHQRMRVQLERAGLQLPRTL
jgi:uncharacterized protein (DUF2267 family)